ncbi:MAG: glycosyltransferase family 1 protein [Ktedonobacteraceae bacterium]
MLFASRALLEGLAKIDQTNDYIVITGRPEEYQMLTAMPNMHIHDIKLRSWRYILIQHQLLLPSILKQIRPDLLHVPVGAAPMGWHGPLVMTVHDLAFLKVPKQNSFYTRLYWQYLLRHSVQRAQGIIAISKQTRDELISDWFVETERIRIIYNALRPSLRYADIARQDMLAMQQRYGSRYLLHVGRIMPRKNLEKLVQAFNLLALRFEDLHLVMTGGTGYGSEEVLRQIEASPYRERIHLAGWVPEQELAALYAGASTLVFPSVHEGFGLPTLEAMACGTPVVASYEAASMEIAGDAVLRTDCATAAPLAEAIAKVLTDDALRERLVQLGRRQVQPYTIEACAKATLRIYEEALGVNKSLTSLRAPGTIPQVVLEEVQPHANITADNSVVSSLSQVETDFSDGLAI